MNNNTITCPSCKTDIELTSAVTQQVRAEMAAEFAAKQREQEAAITAREKEIAQKSAALQKERETLDISIQEKMQLERTRLTAEARKQAESNLTLELGDLREQLKLKAEKLAEAQKAQLELMKRERELEQKQQELNLELEKRLTAEREKIQQQAKQFALEENQLKLADKEKTIEELRKQIENLNLKASKTSQQLQGEVLEQRFEAMLRQAFPFDEISAIKTGAHGADLLQKVRTPGGGECGAILWEIKRTAAFQKTWIPKLKEDQREKSADLAVILTQSMPDDCEHFDQRDGVWITSYHCGLSLAQALRQGLLQLGAARRAAVGQKEKMAAVYQFLCGLEFRQTIEAMVRNYLTLKSDLEKERAAMENIWKRRAKQLDGLILNTAGLYGGLQGIIGAAALPDIQQLTLPEAEGRPALEAGE